MWGLSVEMGGLCMPCVSHCLMCGQRQVYVPLTFTVDQAAKGAGSSDTIPMDNTQADLCPKLDPLCPCFCLQKGTGKDMCGTKESIARFRSLALLMLL